MTGPAAEPPSSRRDAAAAEVAALPVQHTHAAGVASGGVGSDAEQELLGCVSATSAVAVGCAEGDHGDGSQAGADHLQPDALRCCVSEAERRSVHE